MIINVTDYSVKTEKKPGILRRIWNSVSSFFKKVGEVFVQKAEAKKKDTKKVVARFVIATLLTPLVFTITGGTGFVFVLLVSALFVFVFKCIFALSSLITDSLIA